MYIPSYFAVTDVPSMREMVRATKLGILVTSITTPSNPTLPKILSTHLPWVLETEDESSETEYGTLRAHMAKANPQSKSLVELANNSPDFLVEEEVMVVFTATDSYLSTKYYIETKPTTGKVVPTWNYGSVVVYGKAKMFDGKFNPDTGDFLQAQVEKMTEENEKGVGPEKAWKVGDAPKPYIEVMKKAIVGIEIKIDRMEAVWKMSQNKSGKDREGLIQGFKDLGREDIAEGIETRVPPPPKA